MEARNRPIARRFRGVNIVFEGLAMDLFASPQTLAACARKLGKLSETALLAQISCPLLVEASHAEAAGLEASPQNSFRTEYVDSSDLAARALSAERREVWLIKKRADAAFSGHIGVGRTPNLDVCIARSGISKFHAYFSVREDEYLLTDKDSTNGTVVNGSRLEPGQGIVVREGTKIEFANHSFVFMSPARFYKLLQTMP